MLWCPEFKTRFGHVTQRIRSREAVSSANPTCNGGVRSTSRPHVRNRHSLPSLKRFRLPLNRPLACLIEGLLFPSIGIAHLATTAWSCSACRSASTSVAGAWHQRISGGPISPDTAANNSTIMWREWRHGCTRQDNSASRSRRHWPRRSLVGPFRIAARS